jgi:hypothetical protein
VIVKWSHEGTTTMKAQLGRLHLITYRDCWVLKKVVHETCQILSETITHEFRSATNCPASTMTVCPELRGMGFHGQAAAHKPNILPVNAKCCLKWSGVKSDSTGQCTTGNVWFGVRNQAVPCGSPIGWFGCGECLQNDTCQHV